MVRVPRLGASPTPKQTQTDHMSEREGQPGLGAESYGSNFYGLQLGSPRKQ